MVKSKRLKGPVVSPDRRGLIITDSIELLKQSILRLIFTRKGTRPGNLGYGSAVPDMPFTNSADALLNILSYEISESVARWEPRANVSDVRLVEIQDTYVSFEIVFIENITGTVQTLPVTAEFI